MNGKATAAKEQDKLLEGWAQSVLTGIESDGKGADVQQE